MSKYPISPQRVRDLLTYDQETGIFVWKYRPNEKRWNSKNAGKVAGSRHGAGYWHIGIENRKYLAHVLAWAFMMGEWPDGLIDHRNLDKMDNRFENLRIASYPQNCSNISQRENTYSGKRGVYFRKNRRKWFSTITSEHKTEYLGSFDTAEEAQCAYAEAAKRLFGDFCPAYIKAAA